MILFCDTSALLKLYIKEPGSDTLHNLLKEVEAVAVCRIAWAEAFAALSRSVREVPEDGTTVEAAKTAIARDWPHFLVLEINQALVSLAGEYADTFALRGYDSVQLAAADILFKTTQKEVCFACYDARLNKAAKVLGLACL